MVTKTTVIIIKGKYMGEHAAWILVNHKASYKRVILYSQNCNNSIALAQQRHAAYHLLAVTQQFNIAITL